MNHLETRLEIACALAEEAAQMALGFFNNLAALQVTAKNPQDLVSEADLEVERLLRDRLAARFAGESIMGEEFGGTLEQDGWVLDPIDGTGNFVNGSPLWGIAIAYLQQGEPVVGVVAYPALGYTLSAASGLGLRRNGVVLPHKPAQAQLRVIAIGDNNRWQPQALGALELKLRLQGWGMAGYRCATVGMGFSAQGFVHGYIEAHTSLWDLAAGTVLCREAGLRVEFGGHAHKQGMTVIAGSEQILGATRSLIASPTAQRA